MATLIPALNENLTRMNPGEQRLARQLQDLGGTECLCWYKARIGAGDRHPDFIVLDPNHGLVVLEVRDWTAEQLCGATTLALQLVTPDGIRKVVNPLHQARVYALAIERVLAKDPQLRERKTSSSPLFRGCGYAVVLTNISRDGLDRTGLEKSLTSERILCKDDLALTDAASFQKRLWSVLDTARASPLSTAQLTRIRRHLFPEASVTAPTHSSKRALNILDITQEAAARSLGDGHRVIHGVAGSGKTLLLVNRCRQLAKTSKKPVLVLCFNAALAAKLEELIGDRSPGRVVVRDFQAWCMDQLQLHHVPTPKAGDGLQGRLVRAVTQAIAAGTIPKYQYEAIMIDEGHDFEPEWLKIITQMLDPRTNSLLLLYDDAQGIYGKKRSREFSFAKLGVQARGRTSILRVNYRNSSEILKYAYGFAEAALQPADETVTDETLPVIVPETAGRRGQKPGLKLFTCLQEEVSHIATQLRSLHSQGHAWKDMAVLYPARFIGEEVAKQFRALKLPFEWLQEAGQRFRPAEDSVKVMTLHSSKGLEFPIVAIAGIGFMPYREDEAMEDARLLYVGMTRASTQLILTAHTTSDFVKQLMSDAALKIAM